MRVTIRDIARHCDVDVSTVSRALREDPRVAPETRARIQALADKLGYRPNLAARALVAGKTWTIWFITASLQNPLDRVAAESAAMYFHEHGYDMLIAIHHDDPIAFKRLMTRLGQGISDGALIIPSDDSEEMNAILTEMGHRNIPFLFLDRYPSQGHYRLVTSENREGAKQLCQWCEEQGAERIITKLGHYNTVITEREESVRQFCATRHPDMYVPCETTSAENIRGVQRVAIVANSQTEALATARMHADKLEGKDLYFGVFDDWIGDPAPAQRVCVARQDFVSMAGTASRILLELIDKKPVSDMLRIEVPFLRFDVSDGFLNIPS